MDQIHQQMVVSWTILDHAYSRAWVRQCMAIDENEHDPNFRADLTYDYHLMIVIGRTMEQLEEALLPKGWRPPMRRNINAVLPRRN